MGDVSDETLMAFADGELIGDERARIERLLESDPELLGRLSAFVATTPEALAPVFEPVRDAAVPGRLLETIWARPGHIGELAGSRRERVTAASGVAGLLRNGWLQAGAFAAAGIGALAVAGMLGWLLNDILQPQAPHGVQGAGRTARVGIVAGAPVEQTRLIDSAYVWLALERLPMGGRIAVPGSSGGDVTVQPVANFRSKAGKVCRQYETVGSGKRSIGVACREGDGVWLINIEKAAGGPSPGAGAASVGPGPTRLAGARPPAAVDEVVQRLIGGDLLEPDEEARLLERQWR